ncbi:hypothetical protein OB2597_07090 [Pseudooceanicola batsensis HTCC2597]|uniref:AB hydrolase-1 domain-containing protein n=1 Tax=Pseudooceanicola batsensis (strain ATCC BAA-863 / DSM 15984 / KCTC 12145 / HTCC2597) TaxID=252305 RepID=A3TTQ3_PSEBH|nr:alpha/beta hydrolase [Pseudooceanicola batsensis]EAQ05030.1 hypothetical protein OB2597_07090 [Pseudooceanicola batsensis HTCC2597]
MALIRIDLRDGAPALHRADAPVARALQAQAGGTGPVILMIHGFKFAPGEPGNCPHDHILSLKSDHTCRKAKSWPRALGIDGRHPDRLGIAFGWPARGSIWQAYARAEAAGRALARLIRDIRRHLPGRPVHAIAHSMGARVVLSALHDLPPGALSRAILLAGAEYRAHAEAAMATPAGRHLEVINVASRENRLYERLFERLIPAPRPGDRVLGHHAPDAPGWTTLPIDDPETLSALAAHGFRIAVRRRRVCHWSTYLRPGVFDLYAALLAEPDPLPIAALRSMIAPRTPCARPRPPLLPAWASTGVGNA